MKTMKTEKKMEKSPKPKRNPFTTGEGVSKLRMMKQLKDAQGKVDDQGAKIKKTKKK
jgi:hypothetical protein